MKQPKISLSNRQKKVSFDLSVLRSLFPSALDLCLEKPGPFEAPLKDLPGVEFFILSNLAIGRVHQTFFQDPDPNDVITFPYGEILLGAGVIADNASLNGHSRNREAALCIIHGLLHLNGYIDSTKTTASKMQIRQEEILRSVYPPL